MLCEGGLALEKRRLIKDDSVQFAGSREEYSAALEELLSVQRELERKTGKQTVVKDTVLSMFEADEITEERKQAISSLAKGHMQALPGYWLTPCLVALSAWINDDRTLADRALAEALRRDDMKTSLFFVLICCSASRDDACFRWTERYMNEQSPDKLDRRFASILDAYAGGILPQRVHELLTGHLNKYLEELSERKGFEKQQVRMWKESFKLLRRPLNISFEYLSEYSPNWSALENALENVFLNEEIFSRYDAVFADEENLCSAETIKDVISRFLSDYEDEELPLRLREKQNSLIVEFAGDRERAENYLSASQACFVKSLSLPMLLKTVVMNSEPDLAGQAAQRLAAAISKEWIEEAFSSFVAESRRMSGMMTVSIETFEDSISFGETEDELIDRLDAHLYEEMEYVLSGMKLLPIQQYSPIAGAGLLLLAMASQQWLAVPGIGILIYYFITKNAMDDRRKKFENSIDDMRERCVDSLLGVFSDISKYRALFAEKNKIGAKVSRLLEHFEPEQYAKDILYVTSRRAGSKKDSGDAVFCIKCGQELSDDDMFCPNCGMPADDAELHAKGDKNEIPEQAKDIFSPESVGDTPELSEERADSEEKQGDTALDSFSSLFGEEASKTVGGSPRGGLASCLPSWDILPPGQSSYQEG